MSGRPTGPHSLERQIGCKAMDKGSAGPGLERGKTVSEISSNHARQHVSGAPLGENRVAASVNEDLAVR